MKKIVLRYNRCALVTVFFNPNFVSIYKKNTLGTWLISKKNNFFCLNQLATSDPLGRNLITAQNGLEKRKNLYLIELGLYEKDTSTSISNSPVFLHTALDSLKAKLILATQSKLLFRSDDLKLRAEGLSFQISFVPNGSKTFGTLFPYYR